MGRSPGSTLKGFNSKTVCLDKFAVAHVDISESSQLHFRLDPDHLAGGQSSNRHCHPAWCEKQGDLQKPVTPSSFAGPHRGQDRREPSSGGW